MSDAAAASPSPRSTPAPAFVAARPVWPRSLSGMLNCAACFRGLITAGPATAATLRIAAHSQYRVLLNDAFVAFGPARSAHGYARVDHIDLTGHLREGENLIAIEVWATHANTLSHAMDPAFLQAEVHVSSDRQPSHAPPAPVLYTAPQPGPGIPSPGVPSPGAPSPGVPSPGVPSADAPSPGFPTSSVFSAHGIPQRLTRVRRYAAYRGFSEVCDLTRPAIGSPLALAPRSPRRLLPRRVAYHGYPLTTAQRIVSTGRRAPADRKPIRYPWEDLPPDLCNRYPDTDLEADPLARLSPTLPVGRPTDQSADPLPIPAETFAVYDLGRCLTGFLQLEIETAGRVEATLTFDDRLTPAHAVDPTRLECVNAVNWVLPPGRHRLETREPYTARYLQIDAVGGPLEVHRAGIRRLEHDTASQTNPSAPHTAPLLLSAPDDTSASPPTPASPLLASLVEAARHTLAQCATDLLMSRPMRDRAGWLGDSFFIARAAHLLFGDASVEHAFLENILLAPALAKLPEGMLPMCYPADHPDGQFIPQLPMWLILQLEEFAAVRARPEIGRPLVEAFATKIDRLLGWYQRFEREDGLLRALPGRPFIDGSIADTFQQDINFPTSMLYAGALGVAANLYARQDWSDKAARIRESVSTHAFDGTCFIDNATLAGDRLLPTTHRTEICQYFAFHFAIATPSTHPALWQTLLTQLGPSHTTPHPTLHPSPSPLALALRIDLLRRNAMHDIALSDIKAVTDRGRIRAPHPGDATQHLVGSTSMLSPLVASAVLHALASRSADSIDSNR